MAIGDWFSQLIQRFQNGKRSLPSVQPSLTTSCGYATQVAEQPGLPVDERGESVFARGNP
ncbi:hypothetical protein Pan216_31040 [Planctomycetes bacterium Pan216]|uniref:Uncharacterized protein n=1 Tax=Kolteria novifilia TaxID=2527975 RepID=A0A518B5I3_9BACT|nr:hypothetical protein Pan216_31040 [Planctomycetes bacterium Pan216]